MRYIEHTADHEEPMCYRCDNAQVSDELCTNFCGPEHSWFCYRRTERIEDE